MACVMTPSVPSEPAASFGRSYPATFFTTLPPLLASVPSASASVTPMIRSRSAPKRTRSEPLSFVARMPPMVARSGHNGSSASLWPCSASARWKFSTVQPVSTVAVMSAQACSSTRLSRAVERIRSTRCGGLPQPSLVPPPRGLTQSPAASAQRSARASSSALPGSSTIRAATPSTTSAGVAGRMCSAPTIELSSAHGASVSVFIRFALPCENAALECGGSPPPCHSALEQFGNSREFERMRHVRARPFGAQPRPWEDLAGIRQPVRVERAAHALHRFEVGFRKHHRHELLLFLADAVLAGDRAARLDAEFQNAEGQLLGEALLPGDLAVVEHQGMQVAVAGVEDVGYTQARFRAELFDVAHHLGQRRARDHAVLNDVVRRDASHCGESGLAALPDQGAFLLRLRHANLPRAAGLTDLPHLRHQQFHFGCRTIEF